MAASPIRCRASASALVRACGRGARYPLPARGVLYRTPTNARNYQLSVSATLTPFADSTSRSEPVPSALCRKEAGPGEALLHTGRSLQTRRVAFHHLVRGEASFPSDSWIDIPNPCSRPSSCPPRRSAASRLFRPRKCALVSYWCRSLGRKVSLRLSSISWEHELFDDRTVHGAQQNQLFSYGSD